ncbi:MAG: extracellular solute-binding protein [Acetobacterales bacterium]
MTIASTTPVRRALLACTVLVALAAAPAMGAEAPSHHALAMHGEPAHGPDFDHFEFVNPDAPKGGQMVLSAIGTFDTFNPYVIKGTPPPLTGVWDTLLYNSPNEAFTEYGLLAESIQMPDDRSWVAFTLREEARWHDGQPVSVEDVIFSLETLKKDGLPFFRSYYRDVSQGRKTGRRTVRFDFEGGGGNRELPLIIGQMPILPKHWWEGRNFAATTLERPLGSGPYRVADFESGRMIVLERVDDYWGRDLAVNRGRHNIERIRYEYYRDMTVALEGFKAGAFDFRQENNSKLWATSYNFPAVQKGLVVVEQIPNQIPTGMQGFAFNTRRPLFKDARVRSALAHAFDFEWTNENLFYGQYTRTESYFSNSELASDGLPSEEELEILEPLRGQIPDAVFTKEYAPPSTQGDRALRDNLRDAFALLEQAGWVVRDKVLVDGETGQRMSFEILLNSPAFERIVLPFARNLERLGAEVSVRTVDTAQYQNRMDNFDFDMAVESFGQSLSPGNEQIDYWHSSRADDPGSRNIIGISDPAIDKLIELVLSAPDRESLITRTRALDRVLLWHHFVIPNWHIQSFRVAYWNKFGRPAESPKYGLGLDTWWVESAKATQLERGRVELAAAEGPAETGTAQAPADSPAAAAPQAESGETDNSRLSTILAILGGIVLAITVMRIMIRNRRRR